MDIRDVIVEFREDCFFGILVLIFEILVLIFGIFEVSLFLEEFFLYFCYFVIFDEEL